MKFEGTYVEGKILRRYKRFFADVELSTGEIVVAHVPNTGSMATCYAPGWRAFMSQNNDPKKKLKYGLIMLHNRKTWIGIDTGIPNKLAAEAITRGDVPELKGYKNIRREIRLDKGRLDLLLHNGEADDGTDDPKRCYVEIKNVTLLGEKALALFPDAVSTRGLKHLQMLMDLKKKGFRAVMLYIVQREDIKGFAPAEHIDPEYARNLTLARKKGVEVLVYGCELSPSGIGLKRSLPLNF